MLKDKYTFSQTNNTAFHLHAHLHEAYTSNIQRWNSLPVLAFLSLKPFIDRLEKKANSDKKKFKVYLKPVEAVAFHIAYRAGYLDNNNYLVKEIFTAIDRTV